MMTYKNGLFSILVACGLVILLESAWLYIYHIDTKHNGPVDTANTISNSNLALNQGILSAISKLSKGNIVNSTMINTYSGKIIKVNNEGGVNNIGEEYHYQTSISLQNEQSIYPTTLFLTKNDLKKTQIFYRNTPVNINSLQVGDKITVIQQLDLMQARDNAVISLKITKQ